MKTLILISAMFASLSAGAAQTSLIALTAEDEPGKTGYIGVNTSEGNKIAQIYFKKSDGSTAVFSKAQLTQPQILLEKKSYHLVTIRSVTSTDKRMVIAIKYLKNVFTNESKTRFFAIQFNAHINKYEINDESERQFSQAYVTTHRNFLSVAVGIDEIKTQ